MTTTAHATFVVPATAAAPAFWRPAAVATVGAALATTAVAAAAQAAGVSLAIDGQQIPLFAFAQLTVMFAALGVVFAAGLRRWATQPRVVFIRTTTVLTALSLVPDAIVNASIDTKLTLMLTHLVAAAIVIPVVAARLRRS
ncbi:hypothetical protein JGU71_17850 [Antrihabitans sp. YC3-6]|uniref:Cell envelope biogenesis protein OmpA n=1 Tax=Antrihabitans stalagmiti TaxID=2799499 RepID=A0A934NT04_9NOCA|nr:DUF6069 family protein [Antrihabitans stalagmiti]MBJ8340759.1 hypothetical protein [Antrihabitans stalagmiti]